MKRGIWRGFVVLTLFMSLTLLTGTGMVRAENVSSCMNLTATNSVYVLNRSLENENVTDQGGWCIGILAQNIILDCQGYKIMNSSLTISGIYSNETNTTIQNCNITMSSSLGGYGIELQGANNSYILNNTLNGNYNGIRISGANSQIIDNYVTESTHHGIRIRAPCNWMNITGNTVSSNGNDGINTENCNYSTFDGNIMSDNSDDGLVIETGENNSVSNNTIVNNDDKGVLVKVFSNSNTFLNNNISNNDDNGMKFESSSNNNITDSNISGSTTNDVLLTLGSTNNIFLNVSYDTEIVGLVSSLTRKWYYKTYVNDTAGNNVQSANVSLRNVTNILVNYSMTNSTGFTPTYNLTEYINNGGTRTYWKPYNITAEHSSYPTNSSLMNFSNNIQWNITLDNVTPSITIDAPANGTYWNTGLTINGTCSDDGILDSAYTNSTGFAGIDSTPSEFNFTNTSNLVDGANYTIMVYCNDTHNNTNSSEITFTFDITPPQVNITSPISQTYSVSSIDFNVSANENLSYCKFTLTDWVSNYTMTINASKTGSNYTNSSMADGSYTAKFWCNDTAGNINNTESVNFTIDTTAPPYTVSPPSGGGIPSFWKKTYIVNESQFKEGYTKELKVGERFRVKIDGEYHYIGVVELTNATVTINISSTSQQATLSIGEERKFELTNDDYYDLWVRLNSIENSKANLTIKGIHDKIPEICEPNWSCGNWSECINGTQNRTCVDLNSCNVTEGRPEEVRECGIECSPEWSCGNWSECVNDTQNRTCVDLNDCNVTEGRPDEVRSCRVGDESWLLVLALIAAAGVAAIVAYAKIRGGKSRRKKLKDKIKEKRIKIEKKIDKISTRRRPYRTRHMRS